MQRLSVGFWRWFQTRMAAIKGQTPSRLRRQRTSFFSTLPAQVEQLESRELLTVTFHGGAVIANVAAQNIFLGSDWMSTTLQKQGGQLDKFTAMLVQSKFMDGLTAAGYNVYRGSSSAGVIDNIPLDKSFLGNNSGFGGITDAQIQGDIQALINAGFVQAPNANRLYTVFVEPGVIISMADGSNSVNTFLGYHGAFSGTTAGGASATIRYAVIAYPGFPNASFLSQGFSTNFNDLTKVAAHETAEAVTDPDVTFANNTGDPTFLGWIDDFQGEVGDITNFGFLQVFRGYEIQAIAAQDDSPISFNGVTETLTAPHNLVLTAGATSTTGQLSWSASPLAQAYRIFSINGSQRTFIGRTDAFTTSFQLTGLSSGQTVSLLVEAFDGSLVADSTVISGTAPFAQSAAQANAAQKMAAANIASAPHSPLVDHTPLQSMSRFFGFSDMNRDHKKHGFFDVA